MRDDFNVQNKRILMPGSGFVLAQGLTGQGGAIIINSAFQAPIELAAVILCEANLRHITHIV